jgi:hypothetical protein
MWRAPDLRLVFSSAMAASRVLDVLVDNVAVGQTPWERTLAVGRHTVALRGDADDGTPPETAEVRLRDVTHVSLAAEPLDASLRVAPEPASALVAVDGVTVGHGVWEGKLKSGAHKIEVAARPRRRLPRALGRDVRARDLGGPEGPRARRRLGR